MQRHSGDSSRNRPKRMTVNNLKDFRRIGPDPWLKDPNSRLKKNLMIQPADQFWLHPTKDTTGWPKSSSSWARSSSQIIGEEDIALVRLGIPFYWIGPIEETTLGWTEEAPCCVGLVSEELKAWTTCRSNMIFGLVKEEEITLWSSWNKGFNVKSDSSNHMSLET